MQIIYIDIWNKYWIGTEYALQYTSQKHKVWKSYCFQKQQTLWQLDILVICENVFFILIPCREEIIISSSKYSNITCVSYWLPHQSSISSALIYVVILLVVTLETDAYIYWYSIIYFHKSIVYISWMSVTVKWMNCIHAIFPLIHIYRKLLRSQFE